MANHVDYGPFSKADASLFQVFDSFTRLEQQSAARRRHATEIPDIKNQELCHIRQFHRQSTAHYRRIQHMHRLWTEDKFSFLGLTVSDAAAYFRHREVYGLTGR